MSFTAAYRGACADCGEEIQDTDVTYRDGALVHVQCPEGSDALADRRALEGGRCARCGTYHPGEC